MRCPIVILLLALSACSFEEVDLTGKMCPCAAGWECDPATLRCVALVPRDGGFDATPSDGQAPLDAPARDGRVRHDAPGLDAPGLDAGPDASFDGGFDAGPDDTGCDDVHAAALLCDGFEAGAGFPVWTMPRGAAYTTSPVYRGDYAIAARSSPTMALSYLYREIDDVTSGELHGRAYVYVGGDQDPVQLAILHFEEAGSPYDYAQIQIIDGALRIGARNRSAGFEYAVGPAMPRDRWVCLELAFAIGTSAVIQLLMDGAIVATLTHDTTRTMPWQTFYVGINTRGTTQTGDVELFMDEIVVARAPIGCD